MSKKNLVSAIIILIILVTVGYFLSQNKTDSQSAIVTNNTSTAQVIINPLNKAFIDYVIPHHTDALDSSALLLNKTQDQEFQDILKKVISEQIKEVNQLKEWHQKWFNKPYKFNGDYEKMIKPSTGTDLEIQKAYLEGMTTHHSGIIDYAKKVLTDSSNQYQPEVLELAKSIITSQEAQNQGFKTLLETKYKDVKSIENSMKHDSIAN